LAQYRKKAVAVSVGSICTPEYSRSFTGLRHPRVSQSFYKNWRFV
jgi:hypothetical protein